MKTMEDLLGLLDRTNDSFDLKLAAPITLSVLLILVMVRLVWKIPEPLLVVVGMSFLVWSVAFWALKRKKAKGVASPRVAYKQVTQLFLTWILITALLLGSVYFIDRAGWLWFMLTGYNVTLAEDLSDQVNLSIADFVEQHPFFVIDPGDPSKLVLPKGKYDVKDTIIIPRKTALTIEPGTVLRFRAGRSLISYSPITARGSEDESILFTAQQKWLKWGVVGLVQADQSVFEHTRFEHGRQALVNGIDFFGSLSLIETDAEITHSQFVNLFGKDGVYVRKAQVLIRDNVIRDTYKDGLDLDGGTGEISHNQFVNCNDEGIDLGENFDVQVFDNKIFDARGGRISADHNLDQIMALNTLGYSDHD